MTTLVCLVLLLIVNRLRRPAWPSPAEFKVWVDYHHAVQMIEGQRLIRRHWEMRALAIWNKHRISIGMPTDLYHLIPRAQKWTDSEIKDGDWPC